MGTRLDLNVTAFQVVAWDETGLFAASDWFEVGTPPRPKQDFKKPKCWPEFLPAPDPPAPAPQALAPPSADAPPPPHEPAEGGPAPGTQETGVRAVEIGVSALLAVAVAAGIWAKRWPGGRPPLEP